MPPTRSPNQPSQYRWGGHVYQVERTGCDTLQGLSYLVEPGVTVCSNRWRLSVQYF
jgi:hypothetical protein